MNDTSAALPIIPTLCSCFLVAHYAYTCSSSFRVCACACAYAKAGRSRNISPSHHTHKNPYIHTNQSHPESRAGDSKCTRFRSRPSGHVVGMGVAIEAVSANKAGCF